MALSDRQESFESEYRQWRQSTGSENVFAFLENHADASLDAIVEVLLLHQFDCWKAGRGNRVEDYLVRIRLRTRRDLIWQLVEEEIGWRHDLGEKPSLSEYRRRFPFLKKRLLDFFATELADNSDSEIAESNFEPIRDALPATDDELRYLLQHRLKVVLPICSMIWMSILALSLMGVTLVDVNPGSADTFAHLRFPEGRGNPAEAWSPVSDPLPGSRTGTKVALATAALLYVLGALIVWLFSNLSLIALRIIEMTTLVGVVACLTAYRLISIIYLLSPDTRVGSADYYLYLAAALWGDFGWMYAILLYGMVFPRTWAQVKYLTTCLAVWPLAVDILCILWNQIAFGLFWLPVLLSFAMVLAAAAIAVFGSYRLNFKQVRLGSYEVDKEPIGKGNMGIVYRAKHHLLRRYCALKLIRPEYASSPQMFERFDKEVQATAQLRHPNTVVIYDYGRLTSGKFYYVMEYLDGLNLEEILRRERRLPQARVLWILRQLCGSLKEAHAIGLIHRDVKPSNIMLCRHGGLYDFVKLLDFGLVRSGADRETAISGNRSATPAYASPEQCQDLSIDPRSDLYSVGCTAYHLLCGREPFRGSLMEVERAHACQLPPSPSEQGVDISPEFENIILKCLAKSPSDRFCGAQALDEALQSCPHANSWTQQNAQAWWSSIS